MDFVVNITGKKSLWSEHGLNTSFHGVIPSGTDGKYAGMILYSKFG